MGKNIVLIGLPGSGKTTVGALLARQLKKKLLDTDAMIEEKEKCSIPEIFAQKGEEYFRAVETTCAKEAARERDAVIATGGGIVLKAENMEALEQNALVCFLDRSPRDIAQNVDVSGRPLLKGQQEKIYQLHRDREPLYRKYAHGVYSGETPEEVAQAIAAAYERTE